MVDRYVKGIKKYKKNALSKKLKLSRHHQIQIQSINILHDLLDRHVPIPAHIIYALNIHIPTEWLVFFVKKVVEGFAELESRIVVRGRAIAQQVIECQDRAEDVAVRTRLGEAPSIDHGRQAKVEDLDDGSVWGRGLVVVEKHEIAPRDQVIMAESWRMGLEISQIDDAYPRHGCPGVQGETREMLAF